MTSDLSRFHVCLGIRCRTPGRADVPVSSPESAVSVPTQSFPTVDVDLTDSCRWSPGLSVQDWSLAPPHPLSLLPYTLPFGDRSHMGTLMEPRAESSQVRP
ncbi:Hypothetical predicted protein [Marmota monax]|uniref:Uncharacterized protein n=1 Tax=Marmota monax TaxID=9995 RepID=A0A5E4DAF7_MARMO|nr:Hypothetical predicted protein [Marmota monax]